MSGVREFWFHLDIGKTDRVYALDLKTLRKYCDKNITERNKCISKRFIGNNMKNLRYLCDYLLTRFNICGNIFI